jgi:hypothetical protein
VNGVGEEGWAEIVALAEEHGDTVALHIERWSHASDHRYETAGLRLWSGRLAMHLTAPSVAAVFETYRATWASPEVEALLAKAEAWRAELDRERRERDLADRVEAVAAAYGLEVPL